MFKYFDSVLSTLGEPVAGVVVTATTYPGGVPVTLYDDDEITPLTVTTNTEGEYSFNVDAGTYNIIHTYNGVVIETRAKVSIGLSSTPASTYRTPNVQTVTSSATVTPTFDNDAVKITAQGAPLTLANPTGTPIPMLGMVIRIKDDGTARTISYGSQYRAIGITLPTTTVLGKTTYISMIWNSDDTTWDCVATGTQA